MAITNFIRTIWSARMLENLNNNLVYGNVVNRDYEGEVVQAGSVKIPFIGNVTIDDYDGSDIGDPEEMNGDTLTLTIDKKKFFNFAVDDVDKAQMNINVMAKAMERAGYAQADNLDKTIAAEVENAHSVMNDGATPTPGAIEVDKTNAYDLLVDAGVLLDQLNIMKIGRFAIIPSWYEACLIKSDYFAKNPQLAGQTVVNGSIGMVNGISIYVSNNVPEDSGDYSIMVGHPSAISMAMQIDTVEAYRPQGSFKDAVKGLTVFGVKTIVPKAMVKLLVTKKA